MNIKCGICGKEIVIEGDLVDGQHILCPYCGGKSEFHKPTRIDLPDGVQRHRGEGKPLRVIRSDRTSADVPNQAFSRQLKMSEEHVRFYEEMKDLERKRKMRDKAHGALMLIAVILCGVGAYWYIGYRQEMRQQKDIAFTMEKNRLDAERSERERREKAAKVAAETAEREKRLAEEKRRKDEEAKARAKSESDVLEAKILYRQTCALFMDGAFSLISSLPTNSLPGKTEGTYFYLLPFLDNEEIVVCQSSTNGIQSVFRLDGMGKKTPFEKDTFLASLQGKDYLMACGNRVYFRSKRKKARVVQISKTEVVDLGKEFFGDIAPEVKRLDMDPEELRFDVVFIPKDSNKIIVADTVDYGARYSLDKVREAIEDANPMSGTSFSASSERRKFKRTVVLWDGAHIKKGVDGITYVPRVAPSASYWNTTTLLGPGWNRGNQYRIEGKRWARAEHTRAHWKSLYEEAQRQERAEKEFYARLAEGSAARARKAMSREERAYAEKIDRIFDEGALWLRARIEKTK